MIMICVLCMTMTACGPSEEKVAQAQQKYIELKEKHNEVVEAHSIVNDNSYDEQLLALRVKIDEVEAYNLNDMKDEEIDLLIELMDSLIASYDEYQDALTEVKAQEEAAVIVTLPITVVNNTGKAISSLMLYEQGEADTQVNVLENLTPLESGQTLTGLVIRRDVENTPWILAVTCAEASEADKNTEKEEAAAGKEIMLELPVGEYDESGKVLTLTYDEEANTVLLEEKTTDADATSGENTEDADATGDKSTEETDKKAE